MKNKNTEIKIKTVFTQVNDDLALTGLMGRQPYSYLRSCFLSKLDLVINDNFCSFGVSFIHS